jgi:hypothetical protein
LRVPDEGATVRERAMAGETGMMRNGQAARLLAAYVIVCSGWMLISG